MANIQIIKLTSGEDIMGEVSDTEIDGKAFLLIENPAVILMMPKPGSDDEFGVGLAPYAPFAKEHKVPIFPNHIISVYDPDRNLLNAYSQKFGSGLIQVGSPGVSLINKKILNENKK
tara:strand:+ start:580 stop:930 length:351 start_codon:yes stop_codon:yes gene_type:complete